MAAAVTVIGRVPAAAEPGDLASRQTVALTPAPARPVAPAAAEPLAVTIDTLNPSVIPESGNVTITGTVTNTTTETWLGVNVYPLTSDSLSMTSVAELDAAAQALPDQVVGERIVEVSDHIEQLVPGEVQPYTLRVPRRFLGRTEGVHWLGVHALGENVDGRDDRADGRARTFIPLVDDGRPALPTALVLQLRKRIVYAADGRVDQPARWAVDLAPGGRLSTVLEMGVEAGSRPMTWLMDPAVIAAVNSLVAGNPSRMPPAAEPVEEGEEPAPTESPSATTGTGEALTDPTDPDRAVAAAAVQGQEWLDRLPTALAGKQLLTLPYGDVDASAASHLAPELLTGAHTTSLIAMAELGLTGSPAIGSPNGFINPQAIRDADPGTTVLATNAAVGIDAPTLADVDGHEVVLTSATAVEGGPGPDDPLATVAVRQRILSEAAVRLLSPGNEPLVVTLPTDWAPLDIRGFYTGLDVDWIDLSRVSDLTDSVVEAPEPVPAEDFVYPEFQQDFELDAANFNAAEELIGAGGTMQQVLTLNTTVGEAVTREAYTGLSYWQRARVNEARAAATRSRLWIENTLGGVTVHGPPSVTLSSATGQFPATVRNGLDETVLVQIDAAPSSGLTVDVPDPVELDPGESTRLRLSATTEGVGTHTVRLFVATVDGTPLGSSTELPIRSNQVSQIIWIVMIAGGGLLFGAIALRLFRRVRAARAGSAT